MLGSGTSASPYLVSTPIDLDNVRNNMTAYYQLTNDIDMNISPYNEGTGFNPIGGRATPFTGSFDGNGYTIKNLYMNQDNFLDLGMFCDLSGTGIIKNLTVLDANITNTNGNSAGGICGLVTNGATITKCNVVNVNIHGNAFVGGICSSLDGIVSYCSVSGNIYGNMMMGGITGDYLQRSTSTKIIYCYNSANIIGSATSSYIGGIVGRFYYKALIQYSYNIGEITGNTKMGGMVGYVSGSSYEKPVIQYCYSIGKINQVGTTPTNNGAFIGAKANTYYTIDSCYFGSEKVGIAQTFYGGTATTTIAMQTQATFPRWDFTYTWKISPNQYPILQYFAPVLAIDVSVISLPITNIVIIANPIVEAIVFVIKGVDVASKSIINTVIAKNPTINVIRNNQLINGLISNSVIMGTPLINTSKSININSLVATCDVIVPNLQIIVTVNMIIVTFVELEPPIQYLEINNRTRYIGLLPPIEYLEDNSEIKYVGRIPKITYEEVVL